ncbi:MAG TPA: hypothetical protein VFN30_07935 [Chitinophagaceae bacterium]|nr:hypothetical protein [Chitinophagaceae bacterium]
MGYLKKILNNCNETSLLILKNKEEKLSFRQKLEMKFHIYFCKCCENFEKQSNQIDKSLKAYFESINDRPAVKVSDDFKQRVKEKLNQ